MIRWIFRMIAKLLRLLGYAVVACLVIFFAPLLWIWLFTPTVPYQLARPATVAVVVPTPFAGEQFALPANPVLQTAAAVYASEKVSRIVIASEAATSADDLTERGVPGEAIEVEAGIFATSALCASITEIDAEDGIILISQPYLLPRISHQCGTAIAVKHFVTAQGNDSPADTRWQDSFAVIGDWAGRTSVEAALVWASLAGRAEQSEVQFEVVLRDMTTQGTRLVSLAQDQSAQAYQVTKAWLGKTFDQAKAYFLE